VAAWLQPDPLEAGNRPGRKSRRTLRSRPGGGQPYLPPPTTLGAPWGRRCPLPPKKHGRSCRTSSTLQHHSPLTSDFRKRRPPGRCSSDCDLQLQCRLAQVEPLAGAIWHRRHRRYDSARHGDDDDTTTTMPDPCSESVPPRGGEGVLKCLRRPAVGNTWAGWGSMPVVFFPGMAGHLCPTLRATSLSLQGEPADIGKG
jgi:hypothetical protein